MRALEFNLNALLVCLYAQSKERRSKERDLAVSGGLTLSIHSRGAVLL